MKPVLFYSKKCNNCIQLWKFLVSKNHLDSFVKICIDNNKKIPSNIRVVPAVLIKGRQPIYNQAIYLYLNSQSLVQTNTNHRPPNKVDFQKHTKLPNSLDKKPVIKTSTNGLENILDYNPIEMSSALSDSYSFIQSNPEPLDFCYEFIKNDQAPEVPRMPSKKTNNNLDERLQQMQAARRQINNNKPV